MAHVKLGSTVRKIVACSGFDTTGVNLRDLSFDSSVARLLREEFAKMLDENKPRVYTLQEAKGLTGFGPLSGKVRNIRNVTYPALTIFTRLSRIAHLH